MGSDSLPNKDIGQCLEALLVVTPGDETAAGIYRQKPKMVLNTLYQAGQFHKRDSSGPEGQGWKNPAMLIFLYEILNACASSLAPETASSTQWTLPSVMADTKWIIFLKLLKPFYCYKKDTNCIFKKFS